MTNDEGRECPGQHDFHAAYVDAFDRIQDATAIRAAKLPRFGALMAAMPPEQIAEQRERSRSLLVDAVSAGSWEPFDADLRASGALYATLGVDFAEWFDLVGAFAEVLIGELVERHAGEPSRLRDALVAMQLFLDRVMSVIAEEYGSTRERAVRASEQRATRLEVESRQAREASRLKSEFLANMSHELRTPLNAIIGFAELLHDGEVGPLEEQQRDFIGDILTSGQHLLQLINDVLDLSKVEAGKMEFHAEPVDPARLVSEVVGILRTAAASRRIQVETRIDPSLGEVVLDPGRLKQVLYNYLSNALKFSSERSTVRVRVQPDGSASFRLEVEDEGVGIAAADLPELFKEFRQLRGGAAKQHGGTGLGLALTRRIVEAQGGSVAVRSEPGAGSVFCAILPRAAAPAAAPGSRSLPMSVTRAGAPRILVVEDELRDQAEIVAILAQAGYAVEVASTVAEALEACRRGVFDAITLDLILPDGSAAELVRQIRTATPNADVEIIVTSVVTEPGAVAGFHVQEVLSKPIDGERLIAALARVGVQPRRSDLVLVVDDDEKALKLMDTVLTRGGYSVLTCHGGARGLEAIAGVVPAVIVLDLVMPEIDGFAFLDELRSRPSLRRVPVLVWTVKELDADERERLQRAAHAVVTKGRGGASILEALHALAPTPRGPAS